MESTDPIKLTLHDWTGQLITTKLMGSVLSEAGYNIEYVQADYIAQFAGLKTGVNREPHASTVFIVRENWWYEHTFS